MKYIRTIFLWNASRQLFSKITENTKRMYKIWAKHITYLWIPLTLQRCNWLIDFQHIEPCQTSMAELFCENNLWSLSQQNTSEKLLLNIEEAKSGTSYLLYWCGLSSRKALVEFKLEQCKWTWFWLFIPKMCKRHDPQNMTDKILLLYYHNRRGATKIPYRGPNEKRYFLK